MKISDEGLQKLIELEGCVNHVYKDAAGLDTIGVGHLLKEGESFPDGITQDEALLLLRVDLSRFEAAVNTYVKVKLSQPQFDCLTIFAFNVGTGAFKNSTLLSQLNLGMYESIPKQLLRWTKAGGKQVAGLVNRRNAEIELWNATA